MLIVGSYKIHYGTETEEGEHRQKYDSWLGVNDDNRIKKKTL